MILKISAISFLAITIIIAAFIAGSYYGALHLYAVNARSEASLIVRTAQFARNGETQKVINNLELELNRRILESSWNSEVLNKLYTYTGFYEGDIKYLSKNVIKYRTEYPCSSSFPEVCNEINKVLKSKTQ